eukprot:TRINITY_DN18191_c0_g1_i1.p2 TRINITY_DN18191_c0_g1~~TRINITY_DN18191_c0_g1_i1.p2  ORF type:complete len:104 (+),score=44.62 TRINITY_DN18191_c0_g1_i1:63-374(+)
MCIRDRLKMITAGLNDSGDWYNDIPQELEECSIQKNFIQDRVIVPQRTANKTISQDVYLYQLQKIIDQASESVAAKIAHKKDCLLYTSPSPRDQRGSRMPSSA